MPIFINTSLTIPNWSLSIQLHIFAETMVGIAQGIKIAARTKPRPLNSAFNTKATIIPKMASKVTETTAKRTVFQTAFHQAGSTRVPLKMVRPDGRVRQLK